MHSLDDGTSILNRGIVTMPVSTHRTSTWYSLPSNWNCPSKQLCSQSQPFVDLSLWTLKGSTPTSGLNFERITIPQNTLTISENRGPLTLMVYYGILDASMFQIPDIFDSVFSSTHMTTSGRILRSDKDTSPSLYALLLALTSHVCQRLLRVVYHMFPHQTRAPQTLQTSQATSDS